MEFDRADWCLDFDRANRAWWANSELDINSSYLYGVQISIIEAFVGLVLAETCGGLVWYTSIDHDSIEFFVIISGGVSGVGERVKVRINIRYLFTCDGMNKGLIS